MAVLVCKLQVEEEVQNNLVLVLVPAVTVDKLKPRHHAGCRPVPVVTSDSESDSEVTPGASLLTFRPFLDTSLHDRLTRETRCFICFLLWSSLVRCAKFCPCKVRESQVQSLTRSRAFLDALLHDRLTRETRCLIRFLLWSSLVRCAEFCPCKVHESQVRSLTRSRALGRLSLGLETL